jgi:NAD(P)-dependent dehydrogenase (short-subunit alcohol dehydrogenase family)
MNLTPLLVAAFLASPDSSFMTASEVAVDGGLAQL